tara:strand:- start:8691 stop:9014 length:324 start_codon:yes stop_codon:yes gene_type:complete
VDFSALASLAAPIVGAVAGGSSGGGGGIPGIGGVGGMGMGAIGGIAGDFLEKYPLGVAGGLLGVGEAGPATGSAPITGGEDDNIFDSFLGDYLEKIKSGYVPGSSVI